MRVDQVVKTTKQTTMYTRTVQGYPREAGSLGQIKHITACDRRYFIQFFGEDGRTVMEEDEALTTLIPA